jgi:hypothetical protein
MLFRVRCPEGPVHLRARSAPDGPSWARVGDISLEHLERAPPCAERLRAAKSRLARRPAPSIGLEPAGALEGALNDAFAPCEIEPLPELPAGVAPPRWRLRTRARATDALWPFDPELAALDLGLRRALKREAFDEDEAFADDSRLAARGLATRRVGGPDRDGRRTILAARSGAELDALEALERAAREGDPGAVEALGLALGYPACCARAFAGLGPRDDATSFAVRLDHPRAGARMCELLFLNGALALASHLPCEPGCPESRALAGSILARLDAERPGFAARWRALAERLHVIDADGRTLALAADNTPHGVMVREALELAPCIEGSGVEVRTRGDLEGLALTWEGRALRCGGLDAPLVADHRAAGAR